MNDNTFDSQALIDLIDIVKAVSNCKQEYFYFCYGEPSDKVKEILKEFGFEYKVIPNKCVLDLNVDENTALILPKCKPYIKLEWD